MSDSESEMVRDRLSVGAENAEAALKNDFQNFQGHRCIHLTSRNSMELKQINVRKRRASIRQR